MRRSLIVLIFTQRICCSSRAQIQTIVLLILQSLNILLWICLLRSNKATSKLAGHKETVVQFIIVNPITRRSLAPQVVWVNQGAAVRLRHLVRA